MGQTRQELFGRIVKFARSQRERSLEGGQGKCMYRGSEGRMCFVGALIPDDLYIKEVEGRNVRAIVRAYPEISRKVLPSDLAAEEGVCFLESMQHIHDKITPSMWEAEFNSYVTREGLTLPPAEVDHIRYCVQCRDATTGNIGSFAYDESKTSGDFGFHPISPVFDGLSGFYAWAHAAGYRSRFFAESYTMYKDAPQCSE